MPPPLSKRRKFNPMFVLNSEISSLPMNETCNTTTTITTSTDDIHPASSSMRTKAIEETKPPILYRSTGFNRNILYDYIQNPEKYPQEIIYRNEKCTIIYDAYPKAKIHLLLLPNTTYLPHIQCIRDINTCHQEKIKELHQIAQQLIDEIMMYSNHKTDQFPENHPHEADCLLTNEIKKNICKKLPITSSFLMGYHAIPSLYPLHLHILSNDFVSPFMKTKKHWNSFTTDYFVFSKEIDDWLLTKGKSIDDMLPNDSVIKSMLSVSLKCPKCNRICNNMTLMNTHIEDHIVEITI